MQGQRSWNKSCVVCNTYNLSCTSILSSGWYVGCRNHPSHQAISEDDDDGIDVWKKYVKSEILGKLLYKCTTV